MKDAPITLTYEPNDRGFTYAYFGDGNGDRCSIQKSSSISNHIWLGCEDVTVMYNHQSAELPDGYEVYARMHLTQAQVAALIPVLEHFVVTGELPRPGQARRMCSRFVDADDAKPIRAAVKEIRKEAGGK